MSHADVVTRPRDPDGTRALAMHKAAALVAVDGVARDRRRLAELERGMSRLTAEEAHAGRVRVRVYAFGDHLDGGSTRGALVMVPNTGDTDIHVVQGIVLRTVYAKGDEALLSGIDWSTIQLFLLPGGEEISAPGERGGTAG